MHAAHPTDTVPTVSPADALFRAAEYLREHGWIQHDYYAPWGGDQPPCCALGALAIICYGHPIADPFDDGTNDGDLPVDHEHLNRWHDFVTAHQHLYTYLNHQAGFRGMPVDDWNDTPGHTADHIITVLRAAARHTVTATPGRSS
jgi:hypothetical protein